MTPNETIAVLVGQVQTWEDEVECWRCNGRTGCANCDYTGTIPNKRKRRALAALTVPCKGGLFGGMDMTHGWFVSCGRTCPGCKDHPGRQNFDLESALQAWPEPVREAVERHYWAQVNYALNYTSLYVKGSLEGVRKGALKAFGVEVG